MTIMTQGNSDGLRRCDSTCHNAKHSKCTCICGGRYHGSGERAQEMLTRDWFGDDWRERKEQIEADGGSFLVHLRHGAAIVSAARQARGATPRQERLPL
jgi:hypothetical protein